MPIEHSSREELLNPGGMIAGFGKSVSGQEIAYHSPLPGVERALIARATDGKSAMEWETAPVRTVGNSDSVRFVWLAGVGCNLGERRFELFVNGERWGEFRSWPGDEWQVAGKNGSLRFHGVLRDQYGDRFGYMSLTLPVSCCPGDSPVRLRVVGEAAGSQAWFMVFQKTLQPWLELKPQPALIRGENGAWQPVWTDLFFLGESLSVEVSTEFETRLLQLHFGLNRFTLRFPAVSRETVRRVRLRAGEKSLGEERLIQKPVREMEIHLLSHTHLDIGYTHAQEEVLRLQWQYLEQAIELWEKSRHLPPEARYRWNPEELWAVMAYLRQQPQQKQDRLLQTMREGGIGVDGLFGNLLTGLCRPEELFEAVADAESLRHRGVAVESAMITDVPGWTWGLVPVLAQSGIRYLSLGPNSGHRVGHIFELADKPFYWESPSGEERVLCWIHGKGYSWFHTGLVYHQKGTLSDNLLTEERIFPYLAELLNNDFPYSMIPIRYSIGADNGPPDPGLSEVVTEWNRRYVTPKLVISTVASSFKEFEKRYGSRLPVVRGDFTPYWEDGAASTARETALTRRAADRLLQAETMFSLFRPHDYPTERFRQAWQHVLLFNEHTWGAWNSISEPDAPFVRRQWYWKQQQADAACRLADELLEEICGRAENAGSFAVANSCSFARSDLVFLPAGIVPAGYGVVEESGSAVVQQRLGSGELIFLAEDVPGFGVKRFRIERNPPPTDPENEQKDRAEMVIDSATGAISQLHLLGSQWVDSSRFPGLNHYLYVRGRDPDSVRTVSGPIAAVETENGPLLQEWQVTGTAPGCTRLLRRVRLFKTLNRVDLIDELDRPSVREPEGIHIAFPFQLPGGQIRIYSPWAVVQPERDQAPGANRNWFSVANGVAISNNERGVLFLPLDAPLVEIGDLAADPIVCGWKTRTDDSQTLLSYVMNNYWETNYKADQPGLTRFEYSLFFHRKEEIDFLYRRAVARTQPLQVLWGERSGFESKLPVRVRAEKTIVTRLQVLPDRGRWLVRLFNPAEQAETVVFEWLPTFAGRLYRCQPHGEIIRTLDQNLLVPARGLRTVLVEVHK